MKTKTVGVSKNKKKDYSKYWIGQNRFNRYINQYKVDPIGHAIRLQNIKNGVANFVRIVTGKPIPVIFAGNQSATDGSVVVISASDDPADIDNMVGLACHEATHIVRSQHIFTLYKRLSSWDGLATWDRLATDLLNLHDLQEDGYISSDLEDAVIEYARRNGITTPENLTRALKEFYESFRFMINIIEDFRIDEWQYNNAIGYRPYYDAMLDRYFRDPKVQEALQSPEMRTPTMRNYTFHIMNVVNGNVFDPTALPDLQEIADLINLKNIRRFNNEDTVWKHYLGPAGNRPVGHTHTPPEFMVVVWKILSIIYRNITESALDKKGGGESEFGKIFIKQKKFINGEIEKLCTNNPYIQLVKDTQAEVRSTTYNQKEDGVVKKENVVVHKQVKSHTVLYQMGLGGSKNSYSVRGIDNGMRLGRRILHMIRSFADTSIEKTTRQPVGRIDKRLIHQLGHTPKDVFQTSRLVRSAPAFIDMSIDASGSMAKNKWVAAITLAVAYAFVADKLRDVNVRISMRSTAYHYGPSYPTVAVIYDSRIDKFHKVQELFPYLNPQGSTPEGLCFEAIMKELMEESKGIHRFFVNISDGMPEYSFTTGGGSYKGPSAHLHTRTQMEILRRANVHVLSYFISDDNYRIDDLKTAFQYMYGKDAAFIDVDSATQVAKTINKLLLLKGD